MVSGFEDLASGEATLPVIIPEASDKTLMQQEAECG
jgi:hypothetical protein